MVSVRPRMTIPTQRVLRALLAEPGREMYGVEIGRVAGLPSGTVHPILARLEGFGWLESHWEGVDPVTAGRPARRYYSVTTAGAAQARTALDVADRRGAALMPTPAWGDS